MDKIEIALSYISPNLCRDDWVKILMAIKSEFGSAGYDMALQWSRQGDTFDLSAFQATWKSLSDNGKITIATLYRFAIDNGYTSQKNKNISSIPKDSYKQYDAKQTTNIAKRLHKVGIFWNKL